MKSDLIPGDLVMIEWGAHKGRVGLVVALEERWGDQMILLVDGELMKVWLDWGRRLDGPEEAG